MTGLIVNVDRGGVAQMVERSLSMREVPGSIPGISRIFSRGNSSGLFTTVHSDGTAWRPSINQNQRPEVLSYYFKKIYLTWVIFRILMN